MSSTIDLCEICEDSPFYCLQKWKGVGVVKVCWHCRRIDFKTLSDSWENFKPKVPLSYVVAGRKAIKEK